MGFGGVGLIEFWSGVYVGERLPGAAFGPSNPQAILPIATTAALACTPPTNDASLVRLQRDARDADAAVARAGDALQSANASDTLQMQGAEAAVARATQAASAAHKSVAAWQKGLVTTGLVALELLTTALATAKAALLQADAAAATPGATAGAARAAQVLAYDVGTAHFYHTIPYLVIP